MKFNSKNIANLQCIQGPHYKVPVEVKTRFTHRFTAFTKISADSGSSKRGRRKMARARKTHDESIVRVAE